MTDESYFTIGSWQFYNSETLSAETGGWYNGLLDEFRLYDRALSQQEVMALANVAVLYQPVVSDAEVVEDDIVNYKDFAIMADEWLVFDLLWPY